MSLLQIRAVDSSPVQEECEGKSPPGPPLLLPPGTWSRAHWLPALCPPGPPVSPRTPVSSQVQVGPCSTYRLIPQTRRGQARCWGNPSNGTEWWVLNSEGETDNRQVMCRTCQVVVKCYVGREGWGGRQRGWKGVGGPTHAVSCPLSTPPPGEASDLGDQTDPQAGSACAHMTPLNPSLTGTVYSLLCAYTAAIRQLNLARTPALHKGRRGEEGKGLAPHQHREDTDLLGETCVEE